MSGTALDHRLIRDYLSELDAAMRGVPAPQARELKEQITAHLQDALGPDAGDQEVAATLSRLGSPADLAAEAGAGSGSSGPRSALSRWRLTAVIALATVIAAVLGAVQISSEAGDYVASGRDQHLAQLNAAVVKLVQDLEDERDLSAAYAARKRAGPVPVILTDARAATRAAASTVRADAAGIGAGYQPGIIQDLRGLLASITDLGDIRTGVSSLSWPASQVITVYTSTVIVPAIAFSAAVDGGTSDARLQNTVTALAALLRVENDQSVQRAILYAALSAQPPVLAPENLSSLEQTAEQEASDLAAFNASVGTTEQQVFTNTEAGAAVDQAAAQETLAEYEAAASPSAPLTRTGLDAATWYGDMSAAVGDTRQVAGQLVGQITVRANALKSNATRGLLLTSIAMLVLLLVLLISAVLATTGRRQRPWRRQRHRGRRARSAHGPRIDCTSR